MGWLMDLARKAFSAVGSFWEQNIGLWTYAVVVVSPVLHDHTDGIQSQFVPERLVWVSLLEVFPQLGRFCQTLLPFSVLLGLKLRIENKG